MDSPYREEIREEKGRTVRRRYWRDRIVEIHILVGGVWMRPIDLLERRFVR